MQNFRIENFQSVSSAPEYNFGDWRTTNILFDEKKILFYFPKWEIHFSIKKIKLYFMHKLNCPYLLKVRATFQLQIKLAIKVEVQRRIIVCVIHVGKDKIIKTNISDSNPW